MRRRRKHPKKVTDKYKDEKEYWRVEKALKFANKSDKEVVDEMHLDRNNMLLFPTIARCTSSEDEKNEKDEKKETEKRKHHHHHHHHSSLCNKHTMSTPQHPHHG